MAVDIGSLEIETKTKIEKRVGYWYNEEDCNKDYPMPVPRDPRIDLPRTDYNASECTPGSMEEHHTFIQNLTAIQSLLLANYFETNFKSKFVTAYRGSSTCRLCKDHRNGSLEFNMYDPNNSVTYIWPEGYIHYLKDHYVLPDQDFKQFIEGLFGTLIGCCYSLLHDHGPE